MRSVKVVIKLMLVVRGGGRGEGKGKESSLSSNKTKLVIILLAQVPENKNAANLSRSRAIIYNSRRLSSDTCPMSFVSISPYLVVTLRENIQRSLRFAVNTKDEANRECVLALLAQPV